MLDALTFGLFGKGFRGIKKDRLVNSINERGCLVEVYFSIGNKKYRIIRGIKPTRFEIYVNDKMLNQDASSRDYQKHLETNILKLNYRSFTQVVMLGSSSFVPFMQLTAKARREVVEEILDIKIFSLMNWILKEKIKLNKEQLMEIEKQYDLLDAKIILINNHLEKIKEKGDTSLSELKKRVKENQFEIEQTQSSINEMCVMIDEFKTTILPKKEKLFAKKQELFILQKKIETNLLRAEKELSFFKDNDECPTCFQEIDESLKEKYLKERTNKKTEFEKTIKDIKKEVSKMSDRLESFTEKESDVRTQEVGVAKKTASHSAMIKFNDDLLNQIEEIRRVDKDLTEDETKLKIYNEEKKIIKIEKERLIGDKNYYFFSKQLLQDSGIKTKIIKKYLPVMNKLINSYLSLLEFYVQFELDETFNETIKSRYRDEFTYANFSEGEKLRIDLSLLFTWREIAKMKNSTNTNLLILDEIFDSSLDANGVDDFLKILNTLKNENVFIISHKSDLNIDKFDNAITFNKIKNFSKMV